MLTVVKNCNTDERILMRNNNKRVVLQQWKCDVCRVRCFPTLEQATQHEEECGRRMLIAEETKTSNQTVEKPKALHPFFQNQPPATSDPKTTKTRKTAATKIKSTKTASTKTASTAKITSIGKTASTAKITAKTATSKAKTATTKAKTATIKSKFPPPKKKSAVATTSAVATDVAGRKARTGERTATLDVVLDDGRKKPPPKQQEVIDMSSSPPRKDDDMDMSQLAAMFGVDTKTLMEQQRAAEFHGERRRKEDDQRKKREHKKPATTTFTPAASRRGGAIRFPNPNHVIPELHKEEENMKSRTEGVPVWLTEARVATMRQVWLQRTHDDNVNISLDDNDDVKLLPDSSPSVWAHPVLEKDQRLHQLFASASLEIKKAPPLPDTLRMQVLPDDLCGTSIQSAYETILEWVKEWKAVRQRCLDHMEAKQEERRRQHNQQPKKRLRKQYKDHDDDLWDDSDDEQDTGLPSLCLLTGPVGCGKTDLVHALAKHCDCHLLELSTADKRGAAALKKAIGEATQSLGAKHLLQKKSMFASAKTNEPLLDSDDDDGDKGTSLTAILIDEVDILYEQNGDNGFWPALLDLSKRAKCPIFLTANTFPAPLASVQIMYVPMALPSATECADRLQQWIGSLSPQAVPSLVEAASLCGCDLRKLAYELQSFAYAPKAVLPAAVAAAPPVPVELQGVAPAIPVVHIVTPRSIVSHQYSLVTIMGSNFLRLAAANDDDDDGYPVKVSVGDQQCPHARILDDSTILAVCSPVDDCRNPSYAPIRVCGVRGLGIVSDSAGMVVTSELADGTRWAFPPTPVNVERHSRDEDYEFNDDNNHPNNKKTRAPIDWEQSAKLLKDGMDAWRTRHVDVSAADVSTNSEGSSTGLEEMERLCSQFQVASDTALLEVVGIPSLSGPVRGFGFDLTDAFPRCTNETSKRYVHKLGNFS
jgi:hypothetical protein